MRGIDGREFGGSLKGDASAPVLLGSCGQALLPVDRARRLVSAIRAREYILTVEGQGCRVRATIQKPR